jgi:hypothetical protein
MAKRTNFWTAIHKKMNLSSRQILHSLEQLIGVEKTI